MDVVGIDRGVVMAMNPQNGEILAMVSLPSYDNNEFAQGISTAEYRSLLATRLDPCSTWPSASSTRPARPTSW